MLCGLSAPAYTKHSSSCPVTSSELFETWSPMMTSFVCLVTRVSEIVVPPEVLPLT